MENNVIGIGIEEISTTKEPAWKPCYYYQEYSYNRDRIETRNGLHISKMIRINELDKPVCKQFAYRNHKDLIMSLVKVRKAKLPFRYAQQLPERRETKKKTEVQKIIYRKGQRNWDEWNETHIYSEQLRL